MPDNNVAETARSPSSRPCLSVRSHGDDVSVHILKSHRQTGGRGIVFFRFLFSFHVCFYSVFHSTGHLLDAVFPSFSLRSLCPLPSSLCFFSRGKHTCRAAHVKTADDVMGRRLIDKDRLQPCSPFINITSH